MSFSVFLAIALKGFGAVILLAMAYPFKMLVVRYMREGRFKRLLLTRINR